DTIRTNKGTHQFREPGNKQNDCERCPVLSVDRAVFGDLDGDGKEEAAVHLNYSSGGTANWDFLYGYRLEKGRPTLIAFLQAGSRGSGGLVKVTIANKLLILEFADPARREGDCCSNGFIRESYQWKQNRFVRVRRVKGDSKIEVVP